MLRPTSRRGRFSATLFVASFIATLLLPIGTLARGVDAPASPRVTDAPPAERTPKLEGRGIHDVEAGRGQTPKEPLQTLDFVPGRTPTAATPDGPADVTAAPGATLATTSGGPPVTSFGPWAGFDQASAGANCTNSENCGEREPPDSSVAVGPNDVVQAVDTDFRFTDREGTITTPAIDAYEFFQVASFTFEDQPVTIDGISDARWIYDAKHDRWLGTVAAWHCDEDGELPGDDGYGFVLAALSTTGNPRNPRDPREWYHFSVQYDYLPVGPMVGTSADKLVISASEYELSPTTCAGGTLVKDTPSLLTLSWADLMAYPAAPLSNYALIGSTPSDYEAPRPAIAPQGTSNTIFGVVAYDTSPSTSDVISFKITGGLTAASDTITVTFVDLTTGDVVPAFASPPSPVQPGGSLASALSRYPTHAIWQDNVLTFGSTYPCNPGGGIRACARVTQLDTTTPTPTRIQDMLIGTTGKDTWAPGIAQSQNGTLHVVYTQSSSTEGMSSYATYQLPSDSLNTIHTALELADGGATHYNGIRWGDFTMPAQDPRDTNAVWQANQYTKSDGKWATRISELQTPGATFVPIDPVRVLDTRSNLGLSGQFTANIARALTIREEAGIPAAAVAVTGNLTVTGQNASGFLAVTQAPNNNPSTSTLNFPLGDTRANNITAPLATNRSLAIVYRAAAGTKTHVILDITGYFMNNDSGATYTPVPPDRSLDTRSGVGGLSGPFVRGQVRTWTVAGENQIDPNAIAVTGNLTITSQTAAGLVALGPTVASNPTTSSLNAPNGDTRANGITVRLAAGKLQAVFGSQIPGATAHVIFDVTGYYLPGTSGARFVPVTPGRRLDTRVAAPYEGITGAFVANVSRTLVVTPHQGVPNNAKAIAGNLTVVGQTRAGYVSMTQTATSAPPNSTINFPLGDTRANGVTGPLAPAGSVGFVYETLTDTGSTHVILDITGYFR